MAITYAYPTATPETQDLLVGTEMAIQGGEGTPRTRTFTIGSISSLISAPLTAAINLKANITSPTFLGTPSLPTGTIGFTQAAGNSTTALATTSFVTTADNLKANIASPTFTGTVGGITKTMVGLSNVDNTTDLLKPVSTATQTALNLKANIASPTFTGVVTSPSFVKSGGSSAQYLMADGDTTTMPTLQQVTTSGAITDKIVSFSNQVNFGFADPNILNTSIYCTTAGVAGLEVNMYETGGTGILIRRTDAPTATPFKYEYDDGETTATLALLNTAGDFTAKSFIKTGGTSLQYLMANGDTSTFTQDIQSVLDNGGFAENVNVSLQSEGGTTLTLSGTDPNGTLAANAGGGEDGVAVVANGQGGIAIKAIGGTDGIGVRVTSGGISVIGATGAAAPYQLSLSLNSAVKPSTNTWTIASDNRVKTNINPYTKGLETILAINPVTYDYNGKAGFDPTITGNIGVIAQDVLNIIPESINTYQAKLNEEDEEKTELYNFDSHALTFILINAIKQLSAEIELLKSK